MRWYGWGVLGVLLCGRLLAATDTAAPVPAPAPAATEAAARTPAAPPDYLAEGDKLLASKDYGHAVSHYVLAWLATPDNPAVLTRIGNAYFAAAKYADASRFYALAIRLNDSYEDPIVFLGHCYLFLNRVDQAVALLDQPARIKQFEKSARFQHVLGLTYLRMGKYDKATGAFKTAVALAPNASYLHGDMGNVYYLTSHFKEAADEYAKAVELAPSDAVASLNYSMALEKLEKYPEAAAALEQYLKVANLPADHPQRKRLEELNAKGKGKTETAKK